MARLPKDWKRRLIELAAIHGVTDFLAGGRLTAAESKVFYKILGRMVVPITGTAVRLPGRLGGTAGMVAMRHPWIAAGAVIAIGIHEREKIRTLLEQGYDIVEPAVQPVQEFLREEVFTEEHLQRGRERGTIGPPAFLDPLREKFLGKRKPSKFNLAVKAGMKAIKKSTSYGGKGKIKPAKKAFSVVVKLAAAKKKKKKAPKSGIRRRIWNAMKGLR